MELSTFEVSFNTRTGNRMETVRAFNAQQAKRKVLSMVSSKHDITEGFKVKKVVDTKA